MDRDPTFCKVNSSALILRLFLTYITGGASPWDDFTYIGELSDEWGIDATVLRFTDWGNYLVWSCIEDSVQCICVAPLTTPTSIGTRSVISSPTESWEEVGASVNEAPAALYHGGITYLTYSASYCWTASYQLGLLTWGGTGDPALSSSWSKTGPVFSSANGNYGTGSNG
jgi:GH43 family beta-xylosidase